MKTPQRITLAVAFVPFAGAGIVFYLIIRILVPHVSETMHIHPLIAWSVLGTFMLFLPLLFLALLWCKKDGYKLSISIIKQRLRLRRLKKSDILWTAGGTLFAVTTTGIIMVVWDNLAGSLGFHKLAEVIPFIIFKPLRGSNLVILLAWLPLFFFNIVGEEFLWRGYILPRQEAAYGNYSWLVNAGLHFLVHICFGFPLILTVIPLLLVIPYVVYKTKNTYTGMIIHALINGPSFILIALGVLSW